ncbi:hypothetical protein [Bradyrhizobium sp. CCBAU 45389]|uniref:hypothetical protein n=1 Tax=Bradyrhizobium sp. CCBAU 45389 TaxID=858429 RepID=UPI0023063C1F|nr:hypothetical protein [Bradyrhizobium sp. CCBAU 45389]MDA9401998.1 hypothetical protein [Bradyrhizobium sp. CCBAU 45389]
MVFRNVAIKDIDVTGHIQMGGPAHDAWAWFVAAVARCYQRPESVIRRMLRYSAAKGHDAFLNKLAGDPAYFGRQLVLPRHGAKLSNLPLRRESQQAAALLPLLAKDALETGAPDPLRGLFVASRLPERRRRAKRLPATDRVTALAI